MINHAILKDRLALQQRSFTELATGMSVIAVAGATLYNLGFFAPIEWSLISLLTIQDLLVGAAVAALPMAAAAWGALLLGKLIQLAPLRIRSAALIGAPTFMAACFGFFYFYAGPGQSTLGHLACGYLILWVFAATANMFLKSKTLPIVWLVFSLFYIPTVSGMSESALASGTARPISEIETDRGVVRGRVVRVTSAYLLLAQGNTIITMPMNKVREVRRFYITSPEADFLNEAAMPGLMPLAAAATAQN